METELISVIIPSYNRAWCLKRALDSVLSQTWSDLEVIVVDDGSLDNTRELVNNINDIRIRYIYQDKQGPAAARNRGLELARGNMAAFLDSDDCWLPEKLDVQTRFMAETGFRISQTEEVWMRNRKKVNPMRRHAKPAGWIFEKSLHLCLVSPSCVMMDMDLARQGYDFDEAFPACEDYDLWLRISLKHPVGLVPRALTVRHGGRGDQLSSMFTGQDLFRIYSLLKLEKNTALDHAQRKSLESVLIKKAGVYVRGCLKRGRQEEAARVKNLLKGRI